MGRQPENEVTEYMRLRICGQQEMKDAIEMMLAFAVGRRVLSEEEYFDLRLILNELILNALQHGSRDWACATLQVLEHEIMVTVRDHGEGFDPSGICQCSTEHDCGRGLFLVKNICQRMEFTDNGSCITAYLGV